MLQLINKILDLSRIETDQIEAYPKDINVLAVVNSCAKMAGLQAKKASITLLFDMSDPLPALHTDRLHIKQIIVNLLSNAVKFTPEI